MTGILDMLTNAWNTAVADIENIPGEWSNSVAKFQSAAAQFSQLYSQLQSLESVAALDPVTYADYNDLMSRGNDIKSTITDTVAKIGSALNTVQSAVGLSGLGMLGILPAIPLALIAVIAGAIALITHWITDANVKIAQLAAMQTAVTAAQQQGASASQIATIAGTVAEQNSGGTVAGLSSLGTKAIWIMVIGGGLYLLAPTIKKKLG